MFRRATASIKFTPNGFGIAIAILLLSLLILPSTCAATPPPAASSSQPAADDDAPPPACELNQSCSPSEQSKEDQSTMPPKPRKKGRKPKEDPPKGQAKKDEDSDSCALGDDTCSEPPPAQWMSGKWGIGWRLRPGKHCEKFNVKKLVRQIQGIPGVSYVLFGLSQGAKGGRYIAPHSVLSGLSPRTCNERDLFDDLATAFQAAGYKVLVYMATEGPAKIKHGVKDAHDYDEETKTAPSVENWKRYVRERYGSDDVPTLKKAYAEVIVGEYAERYGSKIDGWWFDHASFGNKKLLYKVCKEANPKTIMAFNNGRLPCAQNSSPGLEDYTFGHPTPLRRAPPASKNNLKMVRAVETSQGGFLYADGKPSLGHLFMPMMHAWNKGREPLWTEEQAVDWMSRTLDAGGAWTWNVPCDSNRSELSPVSVEFMKSVGRKLRAGKKERKREEASEEECSEEDGHEGSEDESLDEEGEDDGEEESSEGEAT